MTEFNFGATVEIPKTTIARETAPNPFDGRFPSDDAALPVTLTAATEDDAVKAVNALVARARKAAQAVDRTARKSVSIEATGSGKNKVWTATALFWTVKRQERPGSGNTTSTATFPKPNGTI